MEGNGRRHQRIKKKGHADAERNSRAKFADELRDAREKLWNDAQCEVKLPKQCNRMKKSSSEFRNEISQKNQFMTMSVVMRYRSSYDNGRAVEI